MQTQKNKIDTGKALDADLVVTESSGTELEVQDKSSRSWNDIDTDYADMRPIYDEELIAKEVNSRAKILSHKARNSNKLVDQKCHSQKPDRSIFTRHRFSTIKTAAVHEKTSPRSDISKDDSESTYSSNVDIQNILECKQTLNVSAGTSINVQKEQSLDLSASALYNVNKENLKPRFTMSIEVLAADMIVMTSMIELKFYSILCLTNNSDGENQVVLKSFVVTTADASDKRQQLHDSTSSTTTLSITVTADENFDM
nr:hypothetical protein [Tanacetum cinerariifolium]